MNPTTRHYKDKNKEDLAFVDWNSGLTWLCLFYGLSAQTLSHMQKLYLYNRGYSLDTAYGIVCDVSAGYTVRESESALLKNAEAL